MGNMSNNPLDDRYWNLTAESFTRALDPQSLEYPSASEIAPLLVAAIRHYRNNDIPPFLVHSRKYCIRTGSDRTVVLAERGCYPKVPKEEMVIFRTWNKNYGFWTLDLNGKRLIVRPFPGGWYGGVMYRVWLGCSRGFQARAIATSPARQHGRESIENGKSVNEDSDGCKPVLEDSDECQPVLEDSDECIPLASQLTPVADGLLNGTPRAKRRTKSQAGIMIKESINWINNNKKLADANRKANYRKRVKVKLTLEGPRNDLKHNLPQAHPSSIYFKKQLSPNSNHDDKKSEDTLVSSDGDSGKVSASVIRRREVFSTPEPYKNAIGLKRTYQSIFATDPENIAAASKRRRETLLRRSFPSLERQVEVHFTPEPNWATASSVERSEAPLEGGSDQITLDRKADQLSGRPPHSVHCGSHGRTVFETLNTPGQTAAKVGARSKPISEVVSAEAPSQAATSSNQSHYRSGIEESPQGISCLKSTHRNKSAEELAHVETSSKMTTRISTAEEANLPDLLPPHKLSNTFFLLTIPPNTDFRVVKLSSCATVSDVSTAILKPFRMEDRIDQVDAFRFKFEWLPANASYRTVLIEPDQVSSSFDYVLKRIDKAESAWSNDGECSLGVDILLKSTS